MKKRIVFIFILFFFTGKVTADSTLVDTMTGIDTVLFERGNVFEAVSPISSPVNYEKRLYQNPTVALFKSMVIPGWGQLGNRSYFKAVLFAGLDAWFIGSSIHYGRQAGDFRDMFENAVDINDRNDYHALYDDRRGARNKFRWFAIIVSFVAMFDAYVDAHLSGFPGAVDEPDLSFEIKPDSCGRSMAVISYSF